MSDPTSGSKGDDTFFPDHASRRNQAGRFLALRGDLLTRFLLTESCRGGRDIVHKCETNWATLLLPNCFDQAEAFNWNFLIKPALWRRRSHRFDHEVAGLWGYWADCDKFGADRATDRCTAAGLPRPTAVTSTSPGHCQILWAFGKPWWFNPGRWSDIDWTWNEQQKRRDWLAYDNHTRDGDNGVEIANGWQPVQPADLMCPDAVRAGHVLRGAAILLDGDPGATSIGHPVRVAGSMSFKPLRHNKPAHPAPLFELHEEVTCSPDDFAAAEEAGRPRPRAWAGGWDKDEAGGGFQGTDEELVACALAAGNGGKFQHYYEGVDLDGSPWPGDTGDLTASGRDTSLGSMLLFWTGPDPVRWERLMLESPRAAQRDKLHREGYLEHMYGFLMEGSPQFYSGRGRSTQRQESPPDVTSLPATPTDDSVITLVVDEKNPQGNNRIVAPVHVSDAVVEAHVHAPEAVAQDVAVAPPEDVELVEDLYAYYLGQFQEMFQEALDDFCTRGRFRLKDKYRSHRKNRVRGPCGCTHGCSICKAKSRLRWLRLFLHRANRGELTWQANVASGDETALLDNARKDKLFRYIRIDQGGSVLLLSNRPLGDMPRHISREWACEELYLALIGDLAKTKRPISCSKDWRAKDRQPIEEAIVKPEDPNDMSAEDDPVWVFDGVVRGPEDDGRRWQLADEYGLNPSELVGGNFRYAWPEWMSDDLMAQGEVALDALDEEKLAATLRAERVVIAEDEVVGAGP